MTEYGAGRELDALIAEKVLGFVVKRVKPEWYPAEVTLFCYPNSDLIEYSCDPRSNNAIMFRNGRDDSDGSAAPLPNYSDDIEAAWEVVEHLTRTTKQWFRLEMSCVTNEASFEISGAGDADGDWTAEAETAPLAICRAALKAVGSR